MATLPEHAPLPHAEPPWLRPAILLVATLLVFTWFSGDVTDNDAWWHLKTGEYIWQNRTLPTPDPFAQTTYMGKPLYRGEKLVRDFNLTHEWLAQVIMYWIFAAAGLPGLILARQLVLTALCAIVGLVAWRRSGGFYRALGAALAAAAVAQFVARDRPYLVTFLFVGVTIALLEYRRWLWLLPPILLFWANCHSGFFLGWVVMGAYCAEALYLRRRGQPVKGERRLFLATAISILISGINPDGFRVFEVLLLYRNSPMQKMIFEWYRPKFWEVSAFTVVLYAAAAVLFLARRRVRIADWLLFGLFAAAALSAVRNIILVGIIGPILIASYLPWKRAVTTAVQFLALALLTAGLGWQLSHGAMRYRSAWNLPSGAADFLLQHRASGRLFNTYDTGGYLIWRLWPQLKVFVDGRALNESVYADSQRIAYNAEADATGPSAEELLRKYGIDVIAMPMLDSLGSVYLLPAALADPSQKEWKLVYQDAQAVVYMRTPPAGVQPVNSLDAFTSMEAQCRMMIENSGFAGCALAVSDVFAKIGDSSRATHWRRIRRQHSDLPDSPMHISK
ncbi:MAG TPA: hypothetical protein VN442_10990 [Bryobacteraceae bacterium]|nr:hypothetical protein [Bryobacteraceae bacterium]